MPSGVETFVDGEGFAVLDFVDPKTKGPALAKLIAIGGPESIETITRDGPRRKYRVPEGNATDAGLIDAPVKALATGDLRFAEALARENPQDNPRTHRPDLPDGRFARVEPVPQHVVLGNQSRTTTESLDPTPIEHPVAPPHVAVQAAVKKAKPKPAKRAPRKSTGKTAAPTLASQQGALGSDPQSRPEGV